MEKSSKETATPDKASEVIKVGGDNQGVEVSGVDQPGESAKERKAETILANEARPLEAEISNDPNNESEVQFLQRIMLMQREGGWGRHLDGVILERIAKVNGVERTPADAVKA